MIIDYQADPDTAKLFDVIDADTGELMNDRRIFYADDEAGIYRYHLADAEGVRYRLPGTEEIASEEVSGARIKVQLKPVPWIVGEFKQLNDLVKQLLRESREGRSRGLRGAASARNPAVYQDEDGPRRGRTP